MKEITPRKRRVYWVQRPNEKDLLIFDGGYWGGDIHIYEYKESYPSKRIEEEMKAYYQVKELRGELAEEVVRLWIEKKFGCPLSWKIIGEG